MNIEQTLDAMGSWKESSNRAPDHCIAQLSRLAQRLADLGKLRSPDQFNDEGDGFWAIKARCGLRAYGWYHSKRRRVFVISHFILKTKPRLSQADKARMKHNRQEFDPDYPD